MAVSGRDRDADEARVAQLYRAAASEEPPAHLDRLITDRARAGLRSPAARRTWSAWRLPFALAAVGVVSASLVALMMDEGGERLVREAPVAAQKARAPSAAPADTEPGAGRSTPDSDDLESPLVKREEPQLPPAKQRAPARSSAAGAAPAAAGAQEAAPAAATPTEPRAQESESVATAPARMVAKPLGPAPRQEAPERSAGAASSEMRSRGDEPLANAARRTMAAPPPAAASRESAVVTLHIAELENAPAAAWIDRVLELRRGGRTGEAAALLRALKERFPDAPLPPELQ